MPSLTLPECGRYIPPPATNEDCKRASDEYGIKFLANLCVVEFADLAIIDLSKAHTPEGRAELYPQLRDALCTHGFVYVINHGYTQAQVRRVLVTHAKVS